MIWKLEIHIFLMTLESSQSGKTFK